MKFRLLDLDQSGREDLPRILLYSVLLHYLVLYFMLGNPFLMVINRNGGSSGQAALSVDLLTPGQIEKNSKTGEEGQDPYPIVFPPEEGSDEEDRVEAKGSKADSLSGDGMNLIEQPLPPSAEKKKNRKLPPNMTGPQDCMLKLVGMVCPNGDFECIEAYKSFCENLPKDARVGDRIPPGFGQKQ